MNNGKIWLVVKPTVGLPAFLGGVTIIALCVHAAVLSNAGWYKQYYNGKAAPKTAAATQPADGATPAATPLAAAPPTDGAVVVAQHAPPARR
jgi:light-harvesting protein B-800-850 alpha chain